MGLGRVYSRREKKEMGGGGRRKKCRGPGDPVKLVGL